MFYQLQNWNGGPPNIYDISGSAHFINKCDNGIVIHRNRDPNAGPLDTVQVIFALIFTLSSMRFVYPFLLRRNLIVCQPLCSTTWLLSQVCVRKVRNKVVGQIGDAFLTYDRCVFYALYWSFCHWLWFYIYQHFFTQSWWIIKFNLCFPTGLLVNSRMLVRPLQHPVQKRQNSHAKRHIRCHFNMLLKTVRIVVCDCIRKTCSCWFDVSVSFNESEISRLFLGMACWSSGSTSLNWIWNPRISPIPAANEVES
jgi:hypothetical protein